MSVHPSIRPSVHDVMCNLCPALPQATALATIGKFVVKKKVGEKEAIFGSVTAQELVEAIRMQVGEAEVGGEVVWWGVGRGGG